MQLIRFTRHARERLELRHKPLYHLILGGKADPDFMEHATIVSTPDPNGMALQFPSLEIELRGFVQHDGIFVVKTILYLPKTKKYDDSKRFKRAI